MKNLEKLQLTHCHSYFSLGDSLISPEKMVKRLKELNLDRCTITDHGNLLHIHEFNKYFQKENIKYFPGCEFYYCDDATIKDSEHRKAYHLIIIAKTEQGVKNLYKLSSLSNEIGYYYKPRIDWNMLKENNEGLIISSACLKNQIDTYFLDGKDELAYSEAKKFKELLGNRFYLEIMPHNIEEQIIVNPKIIKLGKDLDIKIITTCDSHFVYKDEATYRRFYILMNKAGWAKDDEEIGKLDTIFMMSSEDMLKHFKMYHPNLNEDDIIDAINNTNEVLSGEAPNVQFPKARFPNIKFDKNKYKDEEDYFNNLMIDGLKFRNLIKPEYIERLKMEVNIIKTAGFINYFLVMYDVFKFCREHNIKTGPGRGSAAGCLISYLLRITELDPLKNGLIFERFFNAARGGNAESAPDIDSDFESSRRQEVIKYLEENYGAENVSQICSISQLKLKSAIKDVSRVLNIPIDVANKITQQFPWDEYENLDDAIEKDDKIKSLVSQNEELFNYVRYFFNFPRQTGKHAAGIIIGDEKIGNICPMMLTKVNGENFLISQFDKDSLKYTGLIKYDFLGLSTLDFLKKISDEIKKITGSDVDWNNIDLEDKKIYNSIFNTGNTDYVFQCESGIFKHYLKKIKLSSFADLSAANTLVRPAALSSGSADKYVAAKHGEYIEENTCDADKIANNLLRDSYGQIIYDEQKMQIAMSIGNFTLEEANYLRKKYDKLGDREETLKNKFIENATNKGWTQEKANHIFESFKGYAFCRAHSYSYSVIGFWCAWAKYYYPIQFLHAMFLISSTSADADKFNVKQAIKFANMLGYKIISADINNSGCDFKFDDKEKKIFWALSSIKGIGEKVAKAIEDGQPYNNFEDFIIYAKKNKITKRAIVPLIMLGAFDSLNCLESIKKHWSSSEW